MDAEWQDRLAIRDLIENWVVWRDAGDWERFRTVWFDDGRMMATWTQGTADEFIAMSKAGWAKGVSILHFLGGQSIDLAGRRAISQTKMTIAQRARGARRRGRRGLHRAVLRFPRKARRPLGLRAAPADLREGPDGSGRSRREAALDPALLAQFPEGYRHLAYLQSQIGYQIKRDMPGLKGEAVERLYASGAKWLRGEALDR